MPSILLIAALVFTDIAGKPRAEVSDVAPCCLTGIVTFVSTTAAQSGVLVSPVDIDGPAIWFAGENNNQVVSELVGTRALNVGDLVEITGTTSRLGFAPGVTARRIRHLGSVDLPSAPLRRLSEFDFGVKDNQRTKLEGVLVSARPSGDRTHLTCVTADGEFGANVPSAAADWPQMVDATLRLEGVATSVFNIRGEFIGVQLEVPFADGVVVVERPPDDPFSRPLSPLGAVMDYSPDGVRLHRRHVRGTVTYVKRGEYVWLQSDDGCLKVRTSDTAFSRGDVVEAVGFFTMEGGLGLLNASTVRETGARREIPPTEVGFLEFRQYIFTAEGAYRDFNGRLVRFSGRVLSFAAEEDGATMTVGIGNEHDRVVVHVDGRVDDLSVADVAWKPQVTVVGVMELRQGEVGVGGQLPAIAGWTVRVSSPEDFGVVHDSAWRTHRAARLRTIAGWVLLSIYGVVLIVLAVNFVLLRIERRRLAILTNERKRMAADLHDTLEQHLAGTRMLLNSAVTFTPDVPETIRQAVANANELLAHAKSEMRARIFDMRNDVLFTQGPEQVLTTIAEKISAGRLISVRTRLRGLPEHLAESVFSEMVFIVQEAITNAIKHGHAKTVVLASDPAPKGFTLRVANDGEPFDPESVLGPEAGHYGLSGMKERAKRAGIGLSFIRSEHLMIVELRVPV